MNPTPTILLPNLPPKTFIGIDLVTFTSTANFHGIRDLPPGWHFIYSGTTEALSLRSGGWFYINGEKAEQEILVWKWDTDTETLVPLSTQQDALYYKANLGTVWTRGGLFRFRSRVTKGLTTRKQSTETHNQYEEEEEEEEEKEGREDWRGLTQWLSPTVLSRIIGTPPVHDADARPSWLVSSGSSAARDSDEIPGTETDAEEVEFSFLPIDLKRTWREGAIGRERTEAAQDRSWALGDVIDQAATAAGETGKGEEHVLGELQFTFLMALTLLNFSCLQQWKRLLELVLTSRRAVVERAGLLCDVLRLLRLQLQRCEDLEGGLFALDAADEGGTFLRAWLVKLARSVDETNASAAVREELQTLGNWVHEEFGWDLRPEGMVRKGLVQLEDGEEVELEMDGDEDAETGEYAPVVV